MRFHACRASSSSWYTVTQRSSGEKPRPPSASLVVSSSHAYAMACSLK
ncbi:hypothetical protein BC477_12885 [Clavibacter michiganensis subsp. michiganensis]|uniref:Uncharacterized protein n=1 Tax=Clavibacter michiganensis subsp. michiganensis TaxID=33013 RepID=A0A251XI28_CLAMM|nr:hypothetical protein BC477_12885 [Clavibacter michiganensis subsp. michiganensis]OUE02690.1 hypothetical protein CMMCAS07_11790 [Clavibacter michiganensis subsp. michiganensis]